MKGRVLALTATIMLLLTVSGCASARYVMKDASTGVVAISANSERHREKAVELMQQHFPAGYAIEREEETVVGQTTHHHVDHGSTIEQNGKRSVETGQVNGTETTVENTEYRIFYRRT